MLSAENSPLSNMIRTGQEMVETAPPQSAEFALDPGSQDQEINDAALNGMYNIDTSIPVKLIRSSTSEFIEQPFVYEGKHEYRGKGALK